MRKANENNISIKQLIKLERQFWKAIFSKKFIKIIRSLK